MRTRRRPLIAVAPLVAALSARSATPPVDPDDARTVLDAQRSAIGG